MNSNKPATDAAKGTDDLIVALPPEILAMMAASEAEMAATENESADEATGEDAAPESDALPIGASEVEASEIEASEIDVAEETDVAELDASEIEALSLDTADVETAELEEPSFEAAEFEAPDMQMSDAGMDDAAPAALQEASLADAPADEAEGSANVDAEMAALLASLSAFPGESAAEPAPAAASEPVEGEAVLALPPVLDITASAGLHTTLLAHRGTPLALDASAVKRLGGQCLQLLISANRTWVADGVPLRLSGVSEAFERDLGLMGLTCDELLQREAA
ncbi:STAS domain-containing protein [Aureimonas sp. AU40]|uniref:STAS domain-containing protein n=1 Tax=Aureimonas sp. AU40 TaxID=1637747 RepID=UPI000AF2ACCF|nr:STAS domain-containing protein [Aureimonas sp. AU40]